MNQRFRVSAPRRASFGPRLRRHRRQGLDLRLGAAQSPEPAGEGALKTHRGEGWPRRGPRGGGGVEETEGEEEAVVGVPARSNL